MPRYRFFLPDRLGDSEKASPSSRSKRDGVQVTIYNLADLTLVRETRELILQKGINRLQFSWANKLIDPPSLEMLPKTQADKLAIEDLTYPPPCEKGQSGV